MSLQSLIVEDVMIMDAGDNIYVWVGSKANTREREHAKGTADVSCALTRRVKQSSSQHYLTMGGIPRGAGAKVVVFKQNEEPEEFKKLFPKWDGQVNVR